MDLALFYTYWGCVYLNLYQLLSLMNVTSHSPSLLDLVEIEKKLREAKAEREKLLRERVSHLPWETLADTSNHMWHTALGTAVWSQTPTQLAHDGPRKRPADVCMFVMHVCSLGECQDWKMCRPYDCEFMWSLKLERELLVDIRFLSIYCKTNSVRAVSLLPFPSRYLERGHDIWFMCAPRKSDSSCCWRSDGRES